MSRVIFMCGPSGAGKTTYARGLEDGGMLRLSFDSHLWARWVTGVNHGYGFGLGTPDRSSLPAEQHPRSIRRFLARIDPDTGYLQDDA